MSLDSLKKRLYISKSISRVKRIKGVMERKQVKQFRIFFRYLQMTPVRFGYLLSLVKPKIEKKDTHFDIVEKIFASSQLLHLDKI